MGKNVCHISKSSDGEQTREVEYWADRLHDSCTAASCIAMLPREFSKPSMIEHLKSCCHAQEEEEMKRGRNRLGIGSRIEVVSVDMGRPNVSLYIITSQSNDKKSFAF